MKWLATLALKGPGQAIGLITALGIMGLMLPPVAIVSSALAALVCLQADASKAVIVLLASTVLATVLGGLLASMPFMGVAMLMVLWAPAAVVAMWQRRNGSLAQTLLMTACLGIGAAIAVNAAVPDMAAAWQSVLNEQFLLPFEGTQQQSQAEQLVKQLQVLGPLLPGLLGMSVMLSVQVALLLARWMQSQVVRPGAFADEFRQLTFGRWPMLAVVLVLIAALVTAEPLWQSLALVVGWLPVKQGIAVMHAFCARPNFAQGRPVLVLGWVLIIVLPHFVVFMAALGAVDNWLNFRQRWISGGGNQASN